jgi:hypothetical protein
VDEVHQEDRVVTVYEPEPACWSTASAGVDDAVRAMPGDVGGVRRTAAEGYQRCIEWDDPDQRRRYLLLVEEILEN